MFGIIIAFKNYKVYGGFLTSFIKSEWVGLTTFKFLFSSKDIWLILRNTLGYNVIFIILGIVAPVCCGNRSWTTPQQEALAKRIRLRCSCLTSRPGSL